MDPEATRNTSLANERTYLAWWRTGLASLAVALGIARIVPDLAKTQHPRWPYTLIGIGFALLGLMQMVYAERRRRAIEAAVLSGGQVGPPNRMLTFAITGASVVLALAILGLLVSGD